MVDYHHTTNNKYVFLSVTRQFAELCWLYMCSTFLDKKHHADIQVAGFTVIRACFVSVRGRRVSNSIENNVQYDWKVRHRGCIRRRLFVHAGGLPDYTQVSARLRLSKV